MILGLSQACYRWMIYPNLRQDLPGSGVEGYRRGYMRSIEPPGEGESVHEWLIARCVELGLGGLYVTSDWEGDRETAGLFRGRMNAAGLVYVGNVSLDFAATAEEWETGEFAAAAAKISWVAAAGGRLAAATHRRAAEINHFTSSPAVSEQLERAVQNFASLVPACAENGVVLALENHMDYRLSELVRVVEGVDSEWVRINMDTGNTIGVIEDPLDGARAAATYAVNAHLKDLRVQPITVMGEPRVFWAPLGQGHVPLRKILELLQASAVDPAALPVMLEVAPPPDQDAHLWVRESIDWLRRECGQCFAP